MRASSIPSAITVRLAGSIVAGLAMVALSNAIAAQHSAVVPAAPPALSTLVIPFEAASVGDDPRVAFGARTFAGGLFITRDGRIVHSLRGSTRSSLSQPARQRSVHAQPTQGWVVTETLLGAQPKPRGATRSNMRVARFAGNDPSQWQRDIEAYDRVALGEAWPGIAVDLIARGDGIEKLFTISPGADIRQVRVRVRGARRLEHVADGSLVAYTGRGPVRFTAPLAWQEIDGARREVPVSYTLRGHRYGFVLGEHAHRHPVFIDPLLQATYLGGTRGDVVYAMAVDNSGAVVVAGSTGSFDFPGTRAGAQPAAAANGDAFVARFDHALSTLTNATYLGGSGNDTAQALAIDADGTVFVAGSTTSFNFPGTTGGAQPTSGGNGDALSRAFAPISR